MLLLPLCILPSASTMSACACMAIQVSENLPDMGLPLVTNFLKGVNISIGLCVTLQRSIRPCRSLWMCASHSLLYSKIGKILVSHTMVSRVIACRKGRASMPTGPGHRNCRRMGEQVEQMLARMDAASEAQSCSPLMIPVPVSPLDRTPETPLPPQLFLR